MNRTSGATEVADQIASKGCSAPRVLPAPVSGLIFAGLLIVLAIAGGTALLVERFRDRALSNAVHDLGTSLALLTRHFEQQMNDAQAVPNDIILSARNDRVSASDFPAWVLSSNINQRLEYGVARSVRSATVKIYDAWGELLASSKGTQPSARNIASRPFFDIFRLSKPVSDLLLETSNSMTSGEGELLFAQKIISNQGEFLGIVTRMFPSADMEQFFGTMITQAGDAVSAYDQDGFLVARYPAAPEMFGRSFKSSPVHREVLANSDHGTLEYLSPIDGKERLAAARRLKGFPISLIVTTTKDGVLADWREQTRWLVLLAVLLAMSVIAILYAILRQIRHRHEISRAELAHEKQRLDTAIDNMSQGLMLFDANARLVVFNKSFLNMYALDSTVVQPGLHFRQTVECRKANGTFKGDVDAYCDDILADIANRRTTLTETGDGRTIQVLSRPVPGGGWVATYEDITERKLAEEKIAHLAHYDSLTDLPNRVLFSNRLNEQTLLATQGEKFAVIYIDIDEFKGINDTLGHQVGDEYLRMIASKLQDCVADCDLVSRLGGDEFAVMQLNVQTQDEVNELIERIYTRLREPIECVGHRLLTDASIGIAMAPRDGTTIDQLLASADLAMYEAKSAGRGTHRFFTTKLDVAARARRKLEADLRLAANDERFDESGFEVHYQPLLSLKHDVVVGCEALVRWTHPEQGPISPAEFIPVAEETGMIAQLGAWVLKKACLEAASWPVDVKIAVNVSPLQFRCPTFALRVISALDTSGLQPRRLELEITEAVLIQDDDVTLDTLHRLRGMGVRIALDDFGTGYSSLSYLQRFPFDKIKIDRCFVTNIAHPTGAAAIVQAVINIAKSRQMTTTAEGVETVAQKECLRSLGCTEMQGFLFSAAKNANDVRLLLNTLAKERGAA